MAPICPTSRKRSTPSDDDNQDEPASKKICREPVLSHTPPPDEDLPTAKVTPIPMFDDNFRELLSRAVAGILEHVGYSGASEEALEALCEQADAYASHFLAEVTTPMLLSRRNETTPLDFAYALHRFSLPTASIEPHLKPPISPLRYQEEEPPLPEEGVNKESLIKLLGAELNGENDKKASPYVPPHFPAFPSQHTYKWTDKGSARETDPRKIREEAAKSSRQAEESLRRLVKVSKAGREKDVKRMADKDPKSKLRHEMWEKTMENLNARKRHSAPRADQDEDRSMMVNSESQYFRKSVIRKRNALPIQADMEMIP